LSLESASRRDSRDNRAVAAERDARREADIPPQCE
jgi:hypothetical protein